MSMRELLIVYRCHWCSDESVCVFSCSELMETSDDFLREICMPSILLVPIEAHIVSVQGRLREHSSFWLNELETSDFVRDIVHYD